MSDDYDDLFRRVAVAICQASITPKQCPCEEKGNFYCADEAPGRAAREAIAIIRQWDAGK